MHNIKALLITLSLSLSIGALAACGGTEKDDPSQDEAQESTLRVWGPWGSCTLIRNGLKVPGYWDAASRCCCYQGDCERQLIDGTISRVGL
jgi:hypothetical protein